MPLATATLRWIIFFALVEFPRIWSRLSEDFILFERPRNLASGRVAR